MKTTTPRERRLGLALSILLLTLGTAYAADSPALLGAKTIDVEGQLHVLGGRALDRPAALVFLGAECPVSNRSIPGLNRLAEEAGKAGVDLFGVISDPTVSRAKAREHEKAFSVAFPVIFDSSGDLARRFEPTHVPECFVIGKDGGVIYRGAIDDRQVDIGKERPEPTRRYLADAIAAAASGKPPAESRTSPVGCIFEAWKPRADARAPRAVTYARDIAPLLNAHCVVCHREGEVAPFSLESYSDASKRARQIARMTERRLMPPWPPSDGWGHFLDDTRLTDDQVARFRSWAEADAPEGDAVDLPPAPDLPRGWKLGEPDLVLTMPEAFDVPADGRDIFRCFVLPTSLAEDKYVAAVDFRPGAPKVVHHVLHFLDTTGAARELDQKDPGPGYKSFGGIGFFPSGGLGGYAPGAQPRALPDGIARRLPKGADVILQVHYHPSGKVERDQSSIGIYFAKKPVEKEVTGVAVITRKIDIPAGESKYERHASLTLPAPVSVIGTAPHMHYIGKEMKAVATTPDGKSVPLVWIKDWNFNWQGQYIYARPIELPAGTRIDVDAVYDNSDGNPRNPSSPPQRVRFGEQTTDEMCICFFQVTTRTPEERQMIRAATLRSLFGR